MSATLIQDALPGEELIAIAPDLRQQVDPSWWLQRLALFNGRALTAPALQSEQAYRAGRLAVLGQCVTHGVVKGLELSADPTASDPTILVTPGYGISATGEDVALMRSLRARLSSLLVIDPLTGLKIDTFPNYAGDTSHTSFAGVLLLQPVTGQASGASLDTGDQPLIVTGNLNASCDQDPEEYAFEDWQVVDGVRLVLVAWPATFPGLTLPAALPAESRRNRLAYTVFNAEMALTPDDRLPWDLLGVPVALVGFDNTWKPAFFDCASVVRTGGLARKRYLLPAQPSDPGTPLLVEPALAQARISQLTEQLGESAAVSSFIPEFAFLPPCGILPAACMDFVHQVALWFPANWTVQVGPVYEEEIETVLLGTMTMQPLDVTADESVDVLVPLPDASYDPDVLVTETLDPAFQAAINDATQELTGVLQHRKAIEQEANALSQAITGTSQPPLYDLNAGLTSVEIGFRDAAVYTPTAGETFGTVVSVPPATTTVPGVTTTTPAPTTTAAPGASSTGNYISQDLQQLINDAGQSPYTLFVDGNNVPLPAPLPLFDSADMADLLENGIQHFIDRINAKLNSANDLLDLAFLTTQADIYRFRQYVLKNTDATALAVSPIVAQIATGESAAVTASNLQSYLSSVLASNSPSAPPTTTTPAPAPAGGGSSTLFTARTFTLQQQAKTVFNSPTLLRSTSALTGAFTGAATASAAETIVSRAAAAPISAATFVPSSPGTAEEPASPTDVLSESPLPGAQLNIRTLTIAQRMADPPSSEGLFYATGNRVALLQLLADLEITIDDIPIVIDSPLALTTGTTPAPTTTLIGTPPPPMPILRDIRAAADPVRRAAIYTAVLTPTIQGPPTSDPDEAALFSTGIHVLEQHSTILRAVEGRIQQYRDFLTECATALTNVQNNLPPAQALASQLDNALAQARQDVIFTTALKDDEQARVDSVNAQRALTLSNVQSVVYTRPRTLDTEADVPSRQLMPGNIANPVPTCINQSVAIPPELREIVALLREAPVSWLPAVQALLTRLERPNLLQNLAVDVQARATAQLQLPLRLSSAASEAGVYAPVIASVYSANQQAFTTFQTARSNFQPAQLANQSWIAQVQILQSVIAPGDLLFSQSVHAEVVNKTSTLIQQISNVATCLYTRASQSTPIRLLGWAEFLRGPGLTIQMQSLAVLPGWHIDSTDDYIQRQQMQMLVDWLFQQIDTTIAGAVGFMSDVVRVAILLAADAPVGEVIGGAVTLATTPVVGGVVSLTLPSDRIAHGMYVQLYSSGVLTAQAVVSDLDSVSVRATVTQVLNPGVALQPNDVAHFSAQAPQAVALRAFDM